MADPLGARAAVNPAFAQGVRADWSKWALLAPALCLLGAFVVLVGISLAFGFRPNVGMAAIGEGWTLGNYAQFFADPFYRNYLTRSVVIACYCTVLAVLLGYPVAFVMAIAGARLRAVIAVIVVSQFFTAYVIRSFALVTILGRDGLINKSLLGAGLIDKPLRIMFSEVAVAIGLVVVCLPFMILPVYSAISSIPPNVEKAAQSLGANAFRTFWSITVPLSLPGLAAGTVLVYLFCFSSYVVPAILGGVKFPMIGNLIVEKAMEAQDFPFAAATAGIALVSSLVIVFLIQKVFERPAMGIRA